MGNVGFVLWLIGLSLMTFFAIAWLLDISNRQRALQEQLGQLMESIGSAEQAPSPAGRTPIAHLETELEQLKTHLPQTIQAVGLVRFQAFSDYGGDQSFAVALADANGNGLLLSSIYAREGTRVYAKPLRGWTSSYSLSFEEEQAIQQAQQRLAGEAEDNPD